MVCQSGVSAHTIRLNNGMKSFGDPPKGGWLAAASSSYSDSDAVVQLVSPSSALFNIMLKYSTSRDDSYQFPSSYLPVCISDVKFHHCQFRIQLLASQTQDINILMRLLPNVFRSKMNPLQGTNPYANMSPGSVAEPRSIQLSLSKTLVTIILTVRHVRIFCSVFCILCCCQ